VTNLNRQLLTIFFYFYLLFYRVKMPFPKRKYLDTQNIGPDKFRFRLLIFQISYLIDDIDYRLLHGLTAVSAKSECGCSKRKRTFNDPRRERGERELCRYMLLAIYVAGNQNVRLLLLSQFSPFPQAYVRCNTYALLSLSLPLLPPFSPSAK
jgi:hypothetical protein